MGEVNCPRAGKWIGGCRFEGRYDVGPPSLVRFRADLSDDPVAIIAASKPTSYVRDVCVTCGRTIERQPTQEPTP